MKKRPKLVKPVKNPQTKVKASTKNDLKIHEFSDLIRDCDSGKITHMGVTESSYPDLIKSLEREGNRKKVVSTEKLNLLVNERKGIPIIAMNRLLAAKPGLVYGVYFKGGSREPKIVGRYKVA